MHDLNNLPLHLAILRGFKYLLFLVIVSACTPIQYPTSSADDSEVDGFIGPLVIDEAQFNRVASTLVYDRLKIPDQLLPFNNNVTYEGTFAGKSVYIQNCKCYSDPKIIQNKLTVTHSYGGGESNRESTKLLWNGTYYQNAKGEYVVDLILHSDKIDVRRALIEEEKTHDISTLKRQGATAIIINLLGYNRLIRYEYP